MGRPRKPTALKIAEGDQPCRINRNEPAAAKGLGPMPDYLLEDLNAAEAWGRLEKLATALGLAQVVDAEALAHYCQSWSLYVEACEDIRTAGLTVMTAAGTPKVNPSVTIRLAAQRVCVKLLTEFGLTPASRSGLDAAPDRADDPFEQFMSRKLSVKRPPDAEAEKKPRRKKDA